MKANPERSLGMICGFSSSQTIRTTYLVAKKAAAIQGCFAECGVATGGSAAAMALALLELEDNRPLHLFDSFEGLPYCGPEDKGQIGHVPGNYLMDPSLPVRDRLKSTGISRGTVDQVLSNFRMWGVDGANVVTHKGWFQDTLPGMQIAPVAFLRFDGDLYESTTCCLEHLYDQVATGGYVWLDEWGMPEGLGGKKAFFDFFAARNQPAPAMLETTDTGAGYWIKS
jgi:O-methyltransferase